MHDRTSLIGMLRGTPHVAAPQHYSGIYRAR